MTTIYDEIVPNMVLVDDDGTESKINSNSEYSSDEEDDFGNCINMPFRVPSFLLILQEENKKLRNMVSELKEVNVELREVAKEAQVEKIDLEIKYLKQQEKDASLIAQMKVQRRVVERKCKTFEIKYKDLEKEFETTKVRKGTNEKEIRTLQKINSEFREKSTKLEKTVKSKDKEIEILRHTINKLMAQSIQEKAQTTSGGYLYEQQNQVQNIYPQNALVPATPLLRSYTPPPRFISPQDMQIKPINTTKQPTPFIRQKQQNTKNTEERYVRCAHPKCYYGKMIDIKNQSSFELQCGHRVHQNCFESGVKCQKCNQTMK